MANRERNANPAKFNRAVRIVKDQGYRTDQAEAFFQDYYIEGISFTTCAHRFKKAHPGQDAARVRQRLSVLRKAVTQISKESDSQDPNYCGRCSEPTTEAALSDFYPRDTRRGLVCRKCDFVVHILPDKTKQIAA